MSKSSPIDLITKELEYINTLFLEVVKIVPSFDITNSKILPYGLKPHTRSISWITEQVISQQMKFNAKDFGLEEQKIIIDLPDTCLHDIEIHTDSAKYFVNIKITNMGNKKQNKNDIAAVEKLYMQYKAQPSYRLIYTVFGVIFENTTVLLDTNYIHSFSPQFLPIYVNPRNDKIQSYYLSETTIRTRDEFLKELEEKSTSIRLK